MKRNQLQLLGNSPRNLGFNLEQNRVFLYSLYNHRELTDAKKWFDVLNANFSWNRKIDSDMNLEKFLSAINLSSDVLLKMGSPNEFEINYCAIINDPLKTRFAWLECSYNKANYQIISKLFSQAFGKNLDSFEVPIYLKEYHMGMFDHSLPLYLPIKKK